ncbi:MAG: DegT/DnrJ/EryC1/StrS family aminotransferase, partial [Microgenomates group bacterium]
AIAKKHHLLVIEDAAEAHGATYKGKLTGSIGDINAFSFYANKIITTGEGGMVTTNNDEFANLARRLKDLAHSPAKRFIHDALGYNYRMTSMQAALGSGQLKHVADFLATKSHMAELYNQGLKDVPGLTLPAVMPWATHVYWMYALTVDEKQFGMDKDELRTKLLEKGIDTRDFFYAPSGQPLLQGLSSQPNYPVTERIAKTGFYLPSGLAITDEQIATVCTSIRDLCSSH